MKKMPRPQKKNETQKKSIMQWKNLAFKKKNASKMQCIEENIAQHNGENLVVIQQNTL
jgi:hypothetical protein